MIHTQEEIMRMGQLVLTRDVNIERRIEIENIKTEKELMWPRIQRMAILEQRDHHFFACPE